MNQLAGWIKIPGRVNELYSVNDNMNIYVFFPQKYHSSNMDSSIMVAFLFQNTLEKIDVQNRAERCAWKHTK